MTGMKLFLISQSDNQDYDTYDSAVVAAETEELARATLPGGDHRTWTGDLALVNVNYIGEAAPGVESGVICASFNAG